MARNKKTEADGAAPTWEVETWPLEKLIPYARNPRKNDHAVEQVAAAIKEYGFRVPVVAKSDGELIDGHLRVKAAQRLGMTEVPVMLGDDMTDVQIKAFRLSVNKMAELAQWDKELLALEFEELVELEYDLAPIGFSEAEIAALASPGVVNEGNTDPDAVGDVPDKPTARLHDIWMLGDHRLMCGSATEPSDLSLLMDGGLADMWLTDPPYNVDYTGKTKDALKIENDKMGDDTFREFLRDAYSAADGVMKPGGVFYIWHADSEGYNFRGACKDVGWQVRQCLIWSKQNMVMGRQDYHWKHEPCLYGWKDGAAHLWATDRKQTTLLEFDRPSANKEHPTMKPVDLFAYQMQNNTKGKDIVLDSFGGSGTTIIAAERFGRCARVMELDPKYVDVIVKRWQEYSGQEATLEGDGRTFNAVSEERLK